MKFDPQKHQRHSVRLKGYDYSQAGAYFVTVIAWQREMLFGEIVNGEMILNEFGEIVSEKWQWLETQYEYVELGAWIVMPNHFHGILVIHDIGRGGSSQILEECDPPKLVMGNPQLGAIHESPLRRPANENHWAD